MLIDNKNINQMFGENNIIGKYYKGNSVNVRTTAISINYNINENNNKLKKIIIDDKKLGNKRVVCSSMDILVHDNNINEHYNDNINNNINSNNYNYKKLVNININNETNKKILTNCVNKAKKLNNQIIINITITKLKKYCSSLKIIKKKK